ncbi:hypothetical protein FGI60_01355 [Brucella haematophila]|nr:hypothetical protein FGI60_01355 [Brucella haematophila]
MSPVSRLLDLREASIATAGRLSQETQRHGRHAKRAKCLPLWVHRCISDAVAASPEEGPARLSLPFWSRSAATRNR